MSRILLSLRWLEPLLKLSVLEESSSANLRTPPPPHQDALALLVPFLGVYPATMLARAAKVPLQQVSKLIQSLGITPYQQPRPDIAAYDHMQGKQPDQELADIIGCSKEAVRQRRVHLEIESYRDMIRRTTRTAK